MTPAKNWFFVKTVDFPLERAGVTRNESDLRRLTRLLRESALLLEASRVSSDSDFRTGSLDLAVRTMRAASIAIERGSESSEARRPLAAVVQGPWEGSLAGEQRQAGPAPVPTSV